MLLAAVLGVGREDDHVVAQLAEFLVQRPDVLAHAARRRVVVGRDQPDLHAERFRRTYLRQREAVRARITPVISRCHTKVPPARVVLAPSDRLKSLAVLPSNSVYAAP